MSDYISALRQDLVEAAARQQQHSPARRFTRPMHPRSWSPLGVLGASAAVAGLLLLVVTLRAVSPPRPPEGPKLIGNYHLGGQPRDAALAGDEIVIADNDGSLLRVSPGNPARDQRRLEVIGTPSSVAAEGSSAWAVSIGPLKDLNGSYLLELDVLTGRLTTRVPLTGYASHVAVGAGGVWIAADLHAGGLARYDPDTRRRTVYVPDVVVEGVAATDRSVWTRDRETVTQWDAGGHVVNRVGGISPTLGDDSQHTLLADAGGAWVVGQSDGLLYRIERGQIVQRIHVGDTAGVIAASGSIVWVTASPGVDRYELVRVDTDEGKVTGRVNVGRFAPQAIVPIGKDVWIVTAVGDLLRVSQG